MHNRQMHAHTCLSFIALSAEVAWRHQQNLQNMTLLEPNIGAASGKAAAAVSNHQPVSQCKQNIRVEVQGDVPPQQSRTVDCTLQLRLYRNDKALMCYIGHLVLRAVAVTLLQTTESIEFRCHFPSKQGRGWS